MLSRCNLEAMVDHRNILEEEEAVAENRTDVGRKAVVEATDVA